jgi:hypothetical protein
LTIVAVVSLTRSAWRSIAIPSHIGVSVSGMPLTQRAGGVGPGALKLRGEQLEPLLGQLGVIERPRAADASGGSRSGSRSQMLRSL